MSQVPLTAEEIAAVTQLESNKNYPQLYEYLRGITLRELDRAETHEAKRELEMTANWLKVAAEINNNAGTFASDMVRGSMKAAATFNGWQLTDEHFQRVSDGIAASIAEKIRDENALSPIKKIITIDVRSANEQLQLENWQWAGTLGDSLPALMGGLGHDYVSVDDSGVEYAKNMTMAIGQNIAGISTYLGNSRLAKYVPAWRIASEMQKYATDNSYKVFRWLNEDTDAGTPNSTQFFQLRIDPSPLPKQLQTDEEQARRDVTDGFTLNTPTHSVQAYDGLLDKTDFVSTQMASLTTSGIRPGEIQLDPNVQPGPHLSQFYAADPINQNTPDYSLRNALMLNGLSTMTTINTFVDPLLLDLTGTGTGAGMTGLDDAVLFDVDNSGASSKPMRQVFRDVASFGRPHPGSTSF